MKILLPFTLLVSTFICSADETVINEKIAKDKLIEKVKSIKAEEIINWHQDEECQFIFFTVLEGLYRDGVSDEIVDLVVGKLKNNDLKKNFVFQCKLCHATYEAFVLYQTRTKFYGTDKKSFGNKQFSKQVIEMLKSSDPYTFGEGLSEIVQPWVKSRLLSISKDEFSLKNKLTKFTSLAQEGEMINDSYIRCQACEAIETIGEILATKQENETK